MSTGEFSAAFVLMIVLMLLGLPVAVAMVLLGELLLRSGMADRMYGAMAAWLSRLPGGLLYTNIACCGLAASAGKAALVQLVIAGNLTWGVRPVWRLREPP